MPPKGYRKPASDNPETVGTATAAATNAVPKRRGRKPGQKIGTTRTRGSGDPMSGVRAAFQALQEFQKLSDSIGGTPWLNETRESRLQTIETQVMECLSILQRAYPGHVIHHSGQPKAQNYQATG